MGKLAKSVLIILVLIIASISIFLLIQPGKDIPQKDSEETNQDNNQATLEEQNTTSQINISLDIPADTEEFEFNPDWQCFNDSGCNDEDICVNHICQTLNCSSPAFTSNHKCIGKSCVNFSDCESNQICHVPQHECIKLQCNLNEYADNHMCKKYQCTHDKDCSSNTVCFYHKCLNQFNTLEFQTINEGNTRNNQKRILNYSLLKNYDVGLFFAQNKADLDYLNETIINLNKTNIDFQENVVVLLVGHGLNPANIRINRIIQEGSIVYLNFTMRDNKTGISDDAWHLITIPRNNFTVKNQLEFKTTPTGNMVIGGELMLSGININYLADKKGDQYRCVNQTLFAYEGKEISLLNTTYFLRIVGVSTCNDSYCASIRIDDEPYVTMQNSSYAISKGLRIDALDMRLRYNKPDGDYLGDIDFGICVND
ncbi:MAG: hypothetical protein V1660_01025 [archaeon]